MLANLGTKSIEKYAQSIHVVRILVCVYTTHLPLLQGIRTFNEWWIGWGVFGFIILCYFAAAKVVNFRLHRALGRDATADKPDQEKEEDEVTVKEKSKEEGSGEQDTEKEKLKEELQAGNPETVTVDLCVEGLKEGSSEQQEEDVAKKEEGEEVAAEGEEVAAEGEEKPREKGLFELFEEAMKSSGLPEPPSFMQEASEEVSKSGGISLSRSSSQGQVRAEIELSAVEQEQKGVGCCTGVRGGECGVRGGECGVRGRRCGVRTRKCGTRGREIEMFVIWV